VTALADDLVLTDQQRAALESRERSVSLSAGAGCGKTFVLTERFLSHVDPRQFDAVADLQELVAITFTDAAAREMRERIRNRCFERLRNAPNPAEAAAWQRIMRTIDSARISTIHSFCTTLLRNHYVEAELDPQFRVLDAPDAELLRLQAVDRRLRRLLEQGDQRVVELSAALGLDRLRSYLIQWASDATIESAEKWATHGPAELTAHWREFFVNRVVPAAACELVQSDALQSLRDVADVSRAATDRLRDHLVQLAAQIEQLVESSARGASSVSAAQIATMCSKLRELARAQGVCTTNDWNDAADYEAYRDASKAVREAIERSVINKAGVADDISTEAAHMGLELLSLAADVSSAVADAKRAANQMEFDDLLICVHRLLTDPAHESVRRRVSSGVRLLMVDEFQDTDPRQVEIVKAFCGENWAERGLFIVGDYKQSIYRFRDAEPRVFAELSDHLGAQGRLSLTANFRSQPAIIDFVNAVFHDAFALPYEPLTTNRLQVSPTPAIEFLWSTDPEEKPADAAGRLRKRGHAYRSRQREARWIARRLRQLIDSREPIVVDKNDSSGAARPVELGDVAILLRSLSDVAVYEEALRECGLDYYLAGGHAFYAQQEIFDVLNLLRAVASRIDEISLAGALRSPMFSLTDAALFWMVETHGSLNAAMSAIDAPQELDEHERAKIVRAAATIRRLREMKDRVLVAELLSEALCLTAYDATLLAEFLGSRKLANIHKLLELARSLDRNSPGDLPSFITQLAEFVARAPKEPLAATQSQGDVIRIMTIHYAKGLEFPLVVLPDLQRPRHPGASEPQLHAELGPVLPGRNKTKSLGWELFRYIEDCEEREERTRLFYVACTRAADYLLLSSNVDDLDRPKGDWLNLLGRRFDLSSGDLTAPLPEAYMAPQIRVTRSEPAMDGPAESRRRVDLDQVVAETRELIASDTAPSCDGWEPLPVDIAARRRFSFSRLTGELAAAAPVSTTTSQESDEIVNAADSATAEEGRTARREFVVDVDARELGVLVHAALERIDFCSPSNVRQLCEFLAPQFTTTVQPEVGASIATEMLTHFLASPRAKQLRSARQMRREVEFLLPWPPKGASDGRYLHGFIDCLYQDESGQWRLLDYKTNHLDSSGVQTVAQQYEMQLFVYAQACEEALGQRPVECTIHFLRSGAEFQFGWDDAATARATQLASDAIRRATNPTEFGDRGAAVLDKWGRKSVKTPP